MEFAPEHVYSNRQVRKMRQLIIPFLTLLIGVCTAFQVDAQSFSPPPMAPPVNAKPLPAKDGNTTDQQQCTSTAVNRFLECTTAGSCDVKAACGDQQIPCDGEFPRDFAGHSAGEVRQAGFLGDSPQDVPVPAILGGRSNQPSLRSPGSEQRPAPLGSQDAFANAHAAATTGDGGLAIQTATAGLRVDAHGPLSIGVGKPARYALTITNVTGTDAERVVVSVEFPTWVDITNVAGTQGSREQADINQPSMLTWTMPLLKGSATERIVIDVMPREARPFDLKVQATQAAQRGMAQVTITEPRLEIHIVGADEVQYGEKTLYHVTVSNPGTGTAEGVVVMLPEALGGERASLGDIAPGRTKEFQVELIARHAGVLELTTTVTAGGNLRRSDTRKILVRRADLKLDLAGPRARYAGSTASYQVTVTNAGDAMARDVVAAVSLPHGVEYVSGIDGAEKMEGGLRWSIGSLPPGSQRAFRLTCQLNAPGERVVEAGARGAGDLTTTASFVTQVQAIADLALSVDDPKGPLPVGEAVTYVIRVRNRGTLAARGVNVVMQFSDGIEPISAQGTGFELVPGQVLFSPIAQVEPGQEVVLQVTARASQSGNHMYRAQLVCEESDERAVAEGTSRFAADDLIDIETGDELTHRN